MRTVYKPLVLVSAELTSEPGIVNSDRTALLRDMLTDTNLSFDEVEGNYFGSKERTFCVVLNNEEEFNVVKNFAFENFGQESVLYLHGDRFAELHYSDGIVDGIGQFKAVDQATALTNKNGYTYSPSLNQYYIVEEGR